MDDNELLHLLTQEEGVGGEMGVILKEKEEEKEEVEREKQGKTEGGGREGGGGGGRGDPIRPPSLPPRRRSTIVETAMLLAALVKQRIRTLAFCKVGAPPSLPSPLPSSLPPFPPPSPSLPPSLPQVRKLVEMVLGYALQDLEATAPSLAPLVKGYRGGYTKVNPPPSLPPILFFPSSPFFPPSCFSLFHAYPRIKFFLSSHLLLPPPSLPPSLPPSPGGPTTH